MTWKKVQMNAIVGWNYLILLAIFVIVPGWFLMATVPTIAKIVSETWGSLPPVHGVAQWIVLLMIPCVLMGAWAQKKK